MESTVDRNARIVSMYADGLTLDMISKEVGLTGERVRQIVAKERGPSANDSRSTRAEQRSAEFEASVVTFCDEIGDGLTTLGGDLTRDQMERRLSVLFPDTPLPVVAEAIKRSGVVPGRARYEPNMPEEMIEAAVWFAIARDNDLKPGPTHTALRVQQAVVEGLADYFASLKAEPKFVSNVIQSIADAQIHAIANPNISITGERYDNIRAEVLAETGAQTGRGMSPWPPTKQTVMSRLGGQDKSWSDALRKLGLGTSDRGRSRGLIQYSKDDYSSAIADFLGSVDAAGEKPTFSAYSEWVGAEKAKGRGHPSGGAVRNVYGSWLDAVRTAGSPEDVGRLTSRNANVEPSIAEQKVASYDRMAQRAIAVADNMDDRLEVLTERMSDGDVLDQQAVLEFNLLTEQRQLVQAQLDLIEQQRVEKQESGETQKRQHKTNILLTILPITLAIAAALAPIFEYWSIWPLGGR